MVQIMRIILLAFITYLLPYPHTAEAVRFPVMTNVEITACQSSWVECSSKVYYSGTSDIFDIGVPTARPTVGVTKVEAVGVHCSWGDAASGVPFSNCTWATSGHAPSTTNCNIVAGSNWVLTADSTCNISAVWGTHSGAGPGGECVVFGIRLSTTAVLTPQGILDPLTAANAGNSICIKPLPPSTVCEVYLPLVIDHGTIVPGTRDTTYIDGLVNCGESPAVSVVGLTDLTLAPGISTKISTSMSSKTDLRIQSDMNVTSSAVPGDYSASIIVAVSPY